MKTVVINMQSLGNACFAWSVVAALHSVQRNAHRKSSYPHYLLVLNLKNIVLPMLNQIKRFENLNDIFVNVYGIEK